jgi:hypothetical protein
MAGKVAQSIQRTLLDDPLRLQQAILALAWTPLHMDKLLEHFAQADETTTRRLGGSGLGLVVCHKGPAGA